MTRREVPLLDIGRAPMVSSSTVSTEPAYLVVDLEASA